MIVASKVLVGVVLCVCLGAMAVTLLPGGEVVHAQTSATFPKAWGPVKGGSGAQIIFEDANGTIRVFDAIANQLVFIAGRN